MNSIRLLAIAGLLAASAVASAQTPPAPPPVPRETVQRRTLPEPNYPQGNLVYPPVTQPQALPQELDSLEAAQRALDCELAGAPTWYHKMMLDANVALQRLRMMCGASKSGACCGMSNVCKGAGCAAGVAGCAKGCELVQAPKACCCAKECACCETCKAAKGQKTVQIERIQIEPMPCPGLPMPCPALQMPGTTWKIAGAPMPMVPHNVFVPVNLGARPAKLVTPDFEAHCDHMTQMGEIIELSGNVLLLCKKHAQPVRIEAQRIMLNLNSGTLSVESGGLSLPRPASVGVLRMSTSTEAVRVPFTSGTTGRSLESAPAAGAYVPASGIIEVVPVPRAPR